MARGEEQLPPFIAKGTSRWQQICRAYHEAAAVLDTTGKYEDRTLAGDVRGWLAKHLGMNATPEVFAARHAEEMGRGSKRPKIDLPERLPHDRGRTR